MPSDKIISEQKKQIRKSIRAQRRALTDDELSLAGEDILIVFKEALKADPLIREAFCRAGNIAVYEACGGELPCGRLADYFREEGKSTLYPRTRDSKMEFCAVKDPSKELVPGNFNIPEPREKLPAVKGEDIDIVIMPGIAFDEEGARVGQGGGYYDRWVSDIKEDERPLLIGVCMSFQMMTKVPSLSSDIRADVVLCV